MSLVDSNAVFESRALAIGISQDTVNALGLRGWVTHATFAFSVATNPGTGDDQPFIDGVLIPILGREDHVDAPKLRRLFYESHTLTAADLRRKVDANEQEAPRKLPPPESSADRGLADEGVPTGHPECPGAFTPTDQCGGSDGRRWPGPLH